MDLIWVSSLPSQTGKWYWWLAPDTAATPTPIRTSTLGGVLHGTVYEGPYQGTAPVSAMGGQWGGFLLVGAFPIEEPT